MSRRIARENVFKLVFEYLFCGEKNDISLQSAINATIDEDKDYISSLYGAVLANSDDNAALIKKYSRDFAYDRIFKIDLAILMLAISEIRYLNIPYQVSANEAVELAKKFSTEKSPSFINGILSSVISELS